MLSIAQLTGKADLYPTILESGSSSTGKFPPTLFIMKRKMPRSEVFTRGGATSTKVTKRMPNQVSAGGELGLRRDFGSRATKKIVHVHIYIPRR